MNNSCKVLRTRELSCGTVDMLTGELKTTETKWVTGPCGSPLFSAAERESGTCRSCDSGWTHPKNYFAKVGN